MSEVRRFMDASRRGADRANHAAFSSLKHQIYFGIAPHPNDSGLPTKPCNIVGGQLWLVGLGVSCSWFDGLWPLRRKRSRAVALRRAEEHSEPTAAQHSGKLARGTLTLRDSHHFVLPSVLTVPLAFETSMADTI